VARTVGHRRWRSRRGSAIDLSGSPQSVGLAGDVPEVVVEGGRLMEEEAAGSEAVAGDVAVDLGSRSTSTEEDVEVEVSIALDGHGRVWRWLAMAKQVANGTARA
jgi:hypothetical protein